MGRNRIDKAAILPYLAYKASKLSDIETDIESTLIITCPYMGRKKSITRARLVTFVLPNEPWSYSDTHNCQFLISTYGALKSDVENSTN